MSPEFVLLSVSFAGVAATALLIFAVWPEVKPTTWMWTMLTVAIAVFNATRVWFGV